MTPTAAVGNKAWTPKQIEAFRKQGKCERHALEMIEAAALLYLTTRDSLLCELSRVDGEWEPYQTKKMAKRLRMLGLILREEADSAMDQPCYLLSGILNRICESHDFAACVWDVEEEGM